MKIAIVHDYLHQFGGAERVVAVLHEMFPDAPIFTSIYNSKNFPEEFQSMEIRTSFMQKLPFIFKNFRAYFMFYPFAFESFDLRDFDLIISSSSAYAKGVRKRKDATHVCYCYNPMRFVWRYKDYMKKEDLSLLVKLILPFFLYPLKLWDLFTSKRVNYFIAISKEIKERIKSIYKRDSDIIYPPVNVDEFRVSYEDGDYFLIVSRLAAYKNIDLAVKAFSELKLPLKIVGAGPALANLKKIAGDNIFFLGKVSEKELKRLYLGCRALVFPGEEDFGIVPLEAAASGRPTIAYAAGGALETIIKDKTGVFFYEQTINALIEAVKCFEKMKFDKKQLREHSEKFSKEIFKKNMRRFLYENKIL